MTVAENFARVRSQIKDAAERYDRDPDSIQLLAVSKAQAFSKIAEALAQGQRCFAENYVQELQEKAAQDVDSQAEWHFVGTIQSKKARDIARLCDWVHSVDRIKVAEALNKHRSEQMSPLNICLQLKLDDEVTKGGVTAEGLFDLAGAVESLPRLNLRGLMAIPKPQERFADQRDSFVRFREFYETLKAQYTDVDQFSAGMSGDFEAAIAEGSTLVRIGTSLFGARAVR